MLAKFRKKSRKHQGRGKSRGILETLFGESSVNSILFVTVCKS